MKGRDTTRFTAKIVSDVILGYTIEGLAVAQFEVSTNEFFSSHGIETVLVSISGKMALSVEKSLEVGNRVEISGPYIFHSSDDESLLSGEVEVFARQIDLLENRFGEVRSSNY